MELGNWYRGGWRVADANVSVEGGTVTFTFNPVSQREAKNLKDYPASFRYTLKVRVVGEQTLPELERIQAFTDSVVDSRSFRIVFEKRPSTPELEVFNGRMDRIQRLGEKVFQTDILCCTNSDPNTFDQTLVTVREGKIGFTFSTKDAEANPVFLPQFGIAVLPAADQRSYEQVVAALESKRGASLYDRVSGLPEQTWTAAWQGVPRKNSLIYLPLGLDGGRQRFRLHANGSVDFRSNDHYLRQLPADDTPRLDLEGAGVRFEFGLPDMPASRGLREESLPVCQTVWDQESVRVIQTAFVTGLGGTRADGPVPEPDTTAVLMLRFAASNTSSDRVIARVPISYRAGEEKTLVVTNDGILLMNGLYRAQAMPPDAVAAEAGSTYFRKALAPGENVTFTLKIPYVCLTNSTEHDELLSLDFDAELASVAGYWRRRLDESARLITPEPVLNSFYRSHARHLLVNCEREPDAARRFARVGSFSYGAYGNESCMMVVDLDRRGLHRAAQECLDAWLKYQGTVALPGDFASKEGTLYGAAGYEAGGYNQHHGWILWCLAEHYRFTRDEAWLKQATPGLLEGADWIIRETARTADRHPLERGLLPAGSLEDIGDWWTWLSTSCYMWRGLDSAAWALEQVVHPDAARIRAAAERYRASLLANFREAALRAPVVRLRDGTSVSHIPSHVHRRGRSFGWICETLEGAIHLLITRAIEPNSAEAEAILKDYEDNLYLSNQYGYTLDDFEQYWFGRGGMSMQACLLLGVEPYLYRDDVKHALRGMFNGIAVSHFPDVHMNTEHALPDMRDWRGDHFKSSDEANACGWLRQVFVREEGEELLVGQAVPREWLGAGQRCGLERAATYFGPMTIIYRGEQNRITARLTAPSRNPPSRIRVRFRTPGEQPLLGVTVGGRPWKVAGGDWVDLPGSIGEVEIIAKYH
jgi:hypothetical protein